MTDAAAPGTAATPVAAKASSKPAPMMAADGTPLKKSLARALRRQKLRALALIAPLLIFVVVTFIAPIADMLFRSVENQIVSDTMPRSTAMLPDWNSTQGKLPPEEIYEAAYYDLFEAAERKEHTRLGTRLNYEMTGMSSLMRQTGRGLDDLGELYQDQFEDLNAFWKKGENWAPIFGSDEWLEQAQAWQKSSGDRLPRFELREGIAEVLPKAAAAYETFARHMRNEEGDNPYTEDPWSMNYTALWQDLSSGADLSGYSGPGAAELREAAAAAPGFESMTFQTAFSEMNSGWDDIEVWRTIKLYSPDYTPGYFVNAIDMQKTPDGIELRPDGERIYAMLFQRTLFMSLVITFSCIILAYPVSYLLSNLPARSANLLMILVLLPFWTSLLVRTSAWKVMLQQQGVINDVLVWLGLVGDANRLVMINNQFGTIVAMTHILLPFMILPMYSVMSTIPPSYVRAAKSLGATNWTAFWRVYFPQSIPGIGAGSILVFILAIGYYITPEIVGGTTGTFISNRIAYHISSSLNWGLAAALGTILLAVVLLLYWVYDRMVGIDNVKLGG